MLVTFVVPEKDLFLPQEIDPLLLVKDVLFIVAMETGVPESQINFMFDGRPIDLSKSFSEQGISDGAMLVTVARSDAATANRQASVPPPISNVSNDETHQFRQYVLGNPTFQQQLSHSRPDILDAVLNNSTDLQPLLQDFNAQINLMRNVETEKIRLLV